MCLCGGRMCQVSAKAQKHKRTWCVPKPARRPVCMRWGGNGEEWQGLRSERWEVGTSCSSQSRVFFSPPQLLHVTGQGGRKSNLFPCTQIFAKKAMDNQELAVQFPK